MIVRTHRSATVRTGFTLMEVLVASTILVILMGATAFGVLRYIDEARVDAAKTKIQTIENAIQSYQLRQHEYPADLMVLTTSQQGVPAYFDRDFLLDPWGNQFGYEPQNRHPTLGYPHVFSHGPDGSTMIDNWPKNN